MFLIRQTQTTQGLCSLIFLSFIDSVLVIDEITLESVIDLKISRSMLQKWWLLKYFNIVTTHQCYVWLIRLPYQETLSSLRCLLIIRITYFIILQLLSFLLQQHQHLNNLFCNTMGWRYPKGLMKYVSQLKISIRLRFKSFG